MDNKIPLNIIIPAAGKSSRFSSSGVFQDQKKSRFNFLSFFKKPKLAVHDKCLTEILPGEPLLIHTISSCHKALSDNYDLTYYLVVNDTNRSEIQKTLKNYNGAHKDLITSLIGQTYKKNILYSKIKYVSDNTYLGDGAAVYSCLWKSKLDGGESFSNTQALVIWSDVFIKNITELKKFVDFASKKLASSKKTGAIMSAESCEYTNKALRPENSVPYCIIGKSDRDKLKSNNYRKITDICFKADLTEKELESLSKRQEQEGNCLIHDLSIFLIDPDKYMDAYQKSHEFHYNEAKEKGLHSSEINDACRFMKMVNTSSKQKFMDSYYYVQYPYTKSFNTKVELKTIQTDLSCEA